MLTKCDKIKPGPLARLIDATVAETAKHGAAHPQIMCTSSKDNAGIAELRAELARLAE